MTTYDHFLLTRVAVRLTACRPGPSEQWLRSRLALFERFCVPSVDAQTAKDFTWLLFVDQSVPAWVVDRVDAAVGQRHEVVQLADAWDDTDVGALVAARSTVPWMVTSRLDSDDALGRRYIERVQARFAGQPEPTFVNFLNGAQYASGRLSTYAHPSNAFLSLIEARQADTSPVTVMSVSHDLAGRDTALLQVREEPLWLQVVHGDNVLNGSSGWRAQPSGLLPHFALVDDLPDLSRGALLVSWVRDALAIGGRIVARPSRLRWIPRYVIARLGRGARAGAETE